jgi:hypothetical protein
MTVLITFGILPDGMPIITEFSRLGNEDRVMRVMVSVDPKLRRKAVEQLGSLLGTTVERLKHELELRDIDTAHSHNDNS